MATSMDKAVAHILEASTRISKMMDVGDADADEVIAAQSALLAAVAELDVYVPLERSFAMNVVRAVRTVLTGRR